MRTSTLVAGILIVLGVIALAYGGITYKKKETIIDAGPLEVTTTKRERIPLHPILGVVALAGGVAILVARRRGSPPG